MIGIALDSILMLLLVCAIGYGVRLERKLVALRAGQLAFAGAVTELNAAAGRAESALGSLRASGEEADLLHDRLIKARQVKTELETLLARAERRPSASPLELRATPPSVREQEETPQAFPARAVSQAEEVGLRMRSAAASPEDDRALRMAALAERIQGMAAPRANAGSPNVSAIVTALTANRSAAHAAQESLSKARRSLDDDLFAA